jgi:hypothetical protein
MFLVTLKLLRQRSRTTHRPDTLTPAMEMAMSKLILLLVLVTPYLFMKRSILPGSVSLALTMVAAAAEAAPLPAHLRIPPADLLLTGVSAEGKPFSLLRAEGLIDKIIRLEWTGPTTCVAPYTCVVANAYFSQCL